MLPCLYKNKHRIIHPQLRDNDTRFVQEAHLDTGKQIRPKLENAN
jgi:hypothetical protein